MKINLLKFESGYGADARPGVAGINLRDWGDVTAVNLFAVAENEGAKVSDSLWGIYNTVRSKLLAGHDPEKIVWSFTCGPRSSRIKFHEIDGRPLKIDMSNIRPFEYEDTGLKIKPLSYYQGLDDGFSSLDDPKKIFRLKHGFDAQPMTAFTLACREPHARDGVFHCIPHGYNNDMAAEQYRYILADTQKTMALLDRTRPKLSEHARNKFSRSTPADWLETSSLLQPQNTGLWHYDTDLGIGMSSGMAAVLQLIRESSPAFFPIALEKTAGERKIQEAIDLIGYGGQKLHSSIQPQPSIK